MTLLSKPIILGMLLLVKQFLTSRAFVNPKGSVRWRHSQSSSSSHDCNPYRRIQRCAGAGGANSAPLHAVESRELRFYGMSPVLLENDSCENGEVESASASSLETPTPLSASMSRENGTGVSLNMSSLMNNLSLSGTTTMNLSSSSDDNNAKDPILNLLSVMNNGKNNHHQNAKKGPQINLTDEEEQLFNLLTEVIHESEITSTLRVAGGWVRDKLLATEEFKRGDTKNTDGIVDRLTSKFKGPSSGRRGSKLVGVRDKSTPQTLVNNNGLPVDIDIALDDMLGREFADHLNEWLTRHGGNKISVGMVLKNPEKSKHLETATMKVGKFWIDFVNLRAEEYTEDSRIPDLMRIGTADEDALRRDLTINSLFYNINTGEVEDFTGKGLNDLKRGVVSTPLPALTTLLDDPLRVLRSVRFAARLRFTMDDSLLAAGKTESVRKALAQKVARERVGSEIDLMLRSQDPVGAMRLIANMNLTSTVFPVPAIFEENRELYNSIFDDGLHLLTVTHDHLCDCKITTPTWCEKGRVSEASANGVDDIVLIQDDEARRLLWYAALLKPLRDHYAKLGVIASKQAGMREGRKKKTRGVIMKLLVDELKRPVQDAKAVALVIKTADDLTGLLNSGCAFAATSCLLNEIRVVSNDKDGENTFICSMGERRIDSDIEDDPEWLQAMEYRKLVAKVLSRAGPLWRAAMVLSLSEQLAKMEDDTLAYTIEGDVFDESQGEQREGILLQYDHFAASILQLGLVGIWSQDHLISGQMIKSEEILPKLPFGPSFGEVMDEQTNWMMTHPGGSREALVIHLRESFSEFI